MGLAIVNFPLVLNEYQGVGVVWREGYVRKRERVIGKVIIVSMALSVSLVSHVFIIKDIQLVWIASQTKHHT